MTTHPADDAGRGDARSAAAPPEAPVDRTQWALGERVKELTCLYGIAQVRSREDATLAQAMEAVAALIPPAWQYPADTSARITIDGAAWDSPGDRGEGACQAADVRVGDTVRGRVEVRLTGGHPAADEGPFLREERNLVDEIARQLGLIVERREAAAQKAALEEQLRRADRLATIGQLAAGVAHELNEPLGAILGYSELIRDSFGLPDSTARDLERIIRASLHAREIVRKLLLFARQQPGETTRVRLEDVVRETLFLLGARLRRSHVRTTLAVATDLPDVMGDAGQLQQVLLNLCVNAIQSMPAGGTLRLAGARVAGGVELAVEDTGTGMDATTLEHVFDPFFTTKDVGQGTGLGLSVVHGIVTAHGGTITVTSTPGRGTRFAVRLPEAT